jgi:hypothetical protein
MTLKNSVRNHTFQSVDTLDSLLQTWLRPRDLTINVYYIVCNIESDVSEMYDAIYMPINQLTNDIINSYDT